MVAIATDGCYNEVMLKNKKNVHPQPNTRDIKQRARLMEQAEKRLSSFDNEIADGYEVLKQFDKTITFFGSARFTHLHPYYKKAREFAKQLSEDGFTIVTGGGNGIMKAGNQGAHDAQQETVGFNIQLPYEQLLNEYATKNTSFHYFFTRKVMLTFFADAYICFPGGFGTLDEFFELVTLMQTEKIPKVPIILVGNRYWKQLDKFIKSQLLKNKTVSAKDVRLYTITEDFSKIRKIVSQS